jgi:divalent metal cation (Fe/Co/Zn/Cd) transporter
METPPDPYRESREAARWGIGVSPDPGGVKPFGGLFGNSLALLSDAVHSLVDAAVSVALLVARYLAQRSSGPR